MVTFRFAPSGFTCLVTVTTKPSSFADFSKPLSFTPFLVRTSTSFPIFFLYCRSTLNGEVIPAEPTSSSKSSASRSKCSSMYRLNSTQSSIETASSLSISCDYRSGRAINNRHVRILRCRSQLPLKYFHNIHLTNEV